MPRFAGHFFPFPFPLACFASLRAIAIACFRSLTLSPLELSSSPRLYSRMTFSTFGCLFSIWSPCHTINLIPFYHHLIPMLLIFRGYRRARTWCYQVLGQPKGGRDGHRNASDYRRR